MKPRNADDRTAWRRGPGLGLALSLALALALLARPAIASQAAAVPDSAAETAADSPAEAADMPSDDWKLCATEISKVEAAEQIPSLLLHAISKIESGRTSPRARQELPGPGPSWPRAAGGICRPRRRRSPR